MGYHIQKYLILLDAYANNILIYATPLAAQNPFASANEKTRRNSRL